MLFTRCLILGFLIFSALLTGCTRKPVEGSSKVIFSVPQNKLSAQSVPIPAGRKACYAVSVSAEDISGFAGSQCQPKTGLVAGFVEANTAMEVTVPKGENRKLDVYLHLKSPGDDGACPEFSGGQIPEAQLRTTYLVAQRTGLSLTQETEEVLIETNFPGETQDLSTQLSYASTCSPTLAQVQFSESGPYDFGALNTGLSAEHTFTLSNSGQTAATGLTATALSAGFEFKGGTFPGQGGTCEGSLQANSSCTIVVRFAPTSAGSRSNTLALSYFNGQGAQNLTKDLLGEGLNPSPAQLVLSSTLNFDDTLNAYLFGSKVVGGILSATFTLTNNGQTPANNLGPSSLTSGFSFLGGAFPGQGGTCTSALAAGSSCTIVVEFAPVSPGPQTTSLSLNYRSGNNQAMLSVSTELRGTGLQPASLAINGSFVFGDHPIGQVIERTLTLTNSGQVPATTLAANLSGPFAFKNTNFPGQGGTCTANLAAGASCSMVITFSPTAAGSYSSPISINYHNGVTAQTVTTTLQGSGLQPAQLSLTSTLNFDYTLNAYPFGSKVVGGIHSATFTLTNIGQTSAVNLNTVISGSGFSFFGGNFPGVGGTCTNSLAANTSCTLKIQFAPTTSGAQTAIVGISFQNSTNYSSSSFAKNLHGVGLQPASLWFTSTTLLYNPSNGGFIFGDHPIGQVIERTLTLTNSGQVPATALALAANLSGPFAFKNTNFPGQGGTCTANLAAGESCSMVITFSPTAAGSYSSPISINYQNGVTAQTVTTTLQGSGLQPAQIIIESSASFDVGTGTYNLGSAILGQSRDHTFTLRNTGQTEATNLSINVFSAGFSFKDGNYPGLGGNCSNSLAPETACILVLSFSPAMTGLNSGSMHVEFNSGPSHQIVDRGLAGQGMSPAYLQFVEGYFHDFGSLAMNQSTEKLLTLANYGDSPATINSAAFMGTGFSFVGDFFPGAGGTCVLNATLTPGSSCTVKVNFSPTQQMTYTGTVNVTYYNGVTAENAGADFAGKGESLNFYPIACDSGTPTTTCTISTLKEIPNNAEITNVTGRLTINSGGELRNTSNLQIVKIQAGEVQISGTGKINSNVEINAAVINVQGSIIADGLGYSATWADRGPGAGGIGNGGSSGGPGGGGGGGGHGGSGGNGGLSATTGSVFGPGGSTNDSPSAPLLPGSAGGGAVCGYSACSGGSGGGIIRLFATTSMDLQNAILSANGAASNNNGGGGGAGGTIKLSTPSLTSNKNTMIRVNGGRGGLTTSSTSIGGGGGGGIIQVTANVNPSGSIQA